MKKFLVALVMLVTSLSLAPAVTTPASASVVCASKFVSKSTHLDAGGTVFGIADKTWYYKVGIGYQSCNSTTEADWVRPKFITVVVNREGTHMKCGALSQNYLGSFFTAYFFDSTGRNYRKPTFSTECSEDTITIRTVFYGYRTTPRLYGTAKFKVNIHNDYPDNVVGADGYSYVNGTLS